MSIDDLRDASETEMMRPDGGLTGEGTRPLRAVDSDSRTHRCTAPAVSAALSMGDS